MMAKVFKFMTGESVDNEQNNIHLNALKEHYLWFSNLSKLNDPFEGAYHLDCSDIDKSLLYEFHRHTLSKGPLSDKEPSDEVTDIYLSCEAAREGGYKDFIVEMIKKDIKEQLIEISSKYSVFSCSLSKDDHESYPSPLNNMTLWGHYANGLRGLCVEFDRTILFESLRESYYSIDQSPIIYSDKKLPVISLRQAILDDLEGTIKTNESLLNAIMTKSAAPWAVENELRMIRDIPEGKVKYSPNAVKNIYIGQKMDLKIREKLLTILNDNYQGISIYEVSTNVERKNYGFDFNKVS
jgi:hypothetical protein